MRAFLVLVSLLLVLLGSGGCGSEERLAEKTLVVALESNPTSLDPRFALDVASSRANRLIFSRLITRDRSSRLTPELALRWRQDGPLSYTFWLRPGVRFHDGRELTASDVKYTFDSMRDPALGSPKAGSYAFIEEVKVLGPYEVKFLLKEPSAAFLSTMVANILPRHAAERAGRAFAENPIGSGPFRFVSFTPDERLELRAFDEYFGGRPPLDRLIYRIIPEGTVRLLEIERGGVGLIQNAFTPDALPRLRQNPRLKVKTFPGTNFSYIGMNLRDPILRRPKVRRALAHAIDRETIIRYILKGLAREADSLLPEGHWAHAPGLPRYGYEPERAKALLDEAGLPDPDGPGPRVRFTLLYKTSQNELRRRIAEVFQEQLREVGVKLKIRSYEWGTFFGDIRSGNFQLYGLTWVGIDDPDIYYYIFHSQMMPPRGANRGGYLNPRVDRLLEEGRRTWERGRRREIYAEIQRILGRELPYINLWHGTNVAVMAKEVRGFEVYPDEDFISLRKVDLRP